MVNLNNFFKPTGKIFHRLRIGKYNVHVYNELDNHYTVVVWKYHVGKIKDASYISCGYLYTPDYLIEVHRLVNEFIKEEENE